MNIRDFGGEFRLIEEVAGKPGSKQVVVGVGDDAAVLDYGTDKLLLWTTDMLCEGDHFRLDWSTPAQIGMKAMHANISDIAAMGGTPAHVLVSLSVTRKTEVEWVRELYRGMNSVADMLGFEIVGGDTTHSSMHVINVTVLGTVQEDELCLRSDAKAGDLICVTGDVGKSMAGLRLLLEGVDGDFSGHLEPKCRLSEAHGIAPYANAMIDVSDGIASEVRHICGKSGVGALVERNKIPVSESTVESGEKLGEDPVDYALNGGEDFELLFTIPEEKLGEINVDCPVTAIGKITGKEDGVKINNNGDMSELTGGFNHFQE